MKRSGLITAGILTTVFLISGGTVAAYADEAEPTPSQEVTSSENTPTPTVSTPTPTTSPGISHPIQSGQENSNPAKTPPNTTGTPTSAASTAQSQHTERSQAEDTLTPTPNATSSPKQASEKSQQTAANTSTQSMLSTEKREDGQSSSPTTEKPKPTGSATPNKENPPPFSIKPGDPGSPENPLTGSGPAPYPDPETVEIWWAMPYPGNATNVTWPQMYASSTNLECGITYQVDTYLKSEAQKFTADGVLNQGEDYQNAAQRGAISWRFVYGGDCIPIVPTKPDDKTDVLDSHDTKDCLAGTVTHIETTQTTTWTLDERTKSWVANVALPVTTETTRPTTEEECKTTSTPGDTPTPTPPTSTPVLGLTPPASTPVDTASRDTSTSYGTTKSKLSSTDSLAKTGNDDAWMTFFELAAFFLIGLGFGLTAGAKFRK